MPQGNGLGLFLYLIHTPHTPVTNYTVIDAFADHTAILTTVTNLERASEKLQRHQYLLQDWLKQGENK